MPLPKYIVRLTANERVELNDLIRSGKQAASVLIHARILLKPIPARTGQAGTMRRFPLPFGWFSVGFLSDSHGLSSDYLSDIQALSAF